MARPDQRCPCHSGRKYKRCCGPLHGGKPAPTALALMRSRYAAYRLGLITYIIDTTDPDGPMWEDDRDAWAAGIDAFCVSTTFAGLAIVADEPGEAISHVTFTATLLRDGQDASMTERSRFRKLGQRWLYSARE